MKVITHYPTTRNASDNLKTQVAQIHIDAAICHINKLSCPTSQKLSLLETISQDRKKS